MNTPTNPNLERYRKLELLLIPTARIDLEEHRGTPQEEVYRLKLEQLELEARERVQNYLGEIGEASRGVL